MNNSIYQFSIGELLDGRYFFIPAYQRGYRWTEKQVGDLLQDLLCFAYDADKDVDAFYCLQPVIAKPITDPDKIAYIFGEELVQDVIAKTAWEVVDGQQRLTTILLLYKYLLDKKGWDEQMLLEEESRTIFKLQYETRPKSAQLLKDISRTYLEENPFVQNENIDFSHMCRAFLFIEKWIETNGKEISIRYRKGESLSRIRDAFFNLLNNKKDANDISVQVLWYQLSDNIENSIKEFQKINTGKIKLTDAELIKGLFLLKRNFSIASNLSQLALEWDFIENTLQSNKFWYFLQTNKTNYSNRIDFIFSLLYKVENLKDVKEDDIDKELVRLNGTLKDEKQSVLFRYFYDKFEGKSGEDLHNEVALAWKNVMNLFRILDDWYNSPLMYNYIGLLSQCGEDVSRLLNKFESLSEKTYRVEFEAYLKNRVRYYLKGIKYDEDINEITTTYSENRIAIKRLLLTLNVEILNEQNRNLEIYSEIYKFPFDLLNSQEWDIEHIDSFQTNELRKLSDKKEWIKVALDDLKIEENEKVKYKKMLENSFTTYELDQIISQLKSLANEDVLEEDKDKVGNLTLLDSKTNRGYGNSLFCTKRRIIIDKIKNGLYVPVGTQYIFAKFFDEYGTNRSEWTANDMKKYHEYVIDKVKEYIY